jgi:type I restriction enzyme S subunit
MSFPRYPKYKASGVEWLGEVPEHWEVKRIKDAASHNDDVLDETTPSDASFAYVDISGVEAGRGIVTTERVTFGTAPSRARRLVRDGDVIVSTVRTYLRAVARVQQPPRDLLVSTGFAVLRPRDGLDPEFLGFAAESSLFVDEVIARSTGVSYPAINASELVRVPLLLPPLAEQRAIAAFLDRETKKIDELVAEQERLIELLKEKRQAVISHAVTKGLDPAAPMKPSGVEWLGDVPAHWEVVPIGHRGRLQNGLSIGGEAFGSGDPFVTYGDVYKNARLPLVPSGLVRSSTTDQQKYGLVDGDVLFTRTSETIDDIGIAATCLQPLPRATFAGFLIRFRPHEGVLEPRYSTYLFRNEGVQGHFAGTMNLVTRASLSQGELRALPICIPPIHEQRAIAEFLDLETSKVDTLVVEAESAISLLTERRSALISAAVTGQIDVRNAVPSANPTEAA